MRGRKKRITERYRYRRGALNITPPHIPPVSDAFTISTSCLLEAGRYDDGSEYQVVRYELTPIEEAKR